MDICYYNTQLREELDGATEYIHKAMHCKKEHPSQASLFYKMSSAELEHATMLIKIFEEDYKNSTTEMEVIPDCIVQVRTTLLDMYAEFSAKIKYLQEMYERL